MELLKPVMNMLTEPQNKLLSNLDTKSLPNVGSWWSQVMDLGTTLWISFRDETNSSPMEKETETSLRQYSGKVKNAVLQLLNATKDQGSIMERRLLR
jgi:hypothetical protein